MANNRSQTGKGPQQVVSVLISINHHQVISHTTVLVPDLHDLSGSILVPDWLSGTLIT